MSDEMKPVAWQWTAKGDRNQFRRLSNVVMWPQGDVVEVRPLVPATTLATIQAAILEKDAEIGRLTAERDAWKNAAPEDIKALFSGVLADFASEQAKRKAAEATVARLQAERNGDVTPEMIAAAWAAWHSRHGGKIGPGPAFVEAITAAIHTRPALPGESDG